MSADKNTKAGEARWDFRSAAAASLEDPDLKVALMRATAKFDDGRRALMSELPGSEDLREKARRIKDEALSSLGDLVEQFAANVEAAGGAVHFADDAETANAVVVDIARNAGVQRVVKSKSMVTEETHLNDALEAAGLHVAETDFGEYILQVAKDHPSHIVVPVVHRTREQIAKVINEAFGGDLPADPTALAKDARTRLRAEFEQADMGITGANFAAADSGAVIQVTNEGNGRLTTTWPRVHVVIMGIEKILPRFEDLPVFLKLLARSATGQPSTIYTNMITGPRSTKEGDGAEEMHVVLVDNGRSRVLGSDYREVLRCIRCGACLNTCPVYQTVGGHAYGAVYPGPIGSLLTPLYEGRSRFRELPQASSLCGACREACPVKINIPQLLLMMKAEQQASEDADRRERSAFRLWAFGMRRPALFAFGARLLRWALRPFSRRGFTNTRIGPLAGWTGHRSFPLPAKKSFRRRWYERRGR